MILVKDPNSWEASFYTAYFKAVGCRIIDIESTAVTFSNSIYSVIALIKKYVSEPEQIQTIDEVTARCTNLGQMLFTGAFNYYKGLSNDVRPQHNKELTNRLYAVSMISATLGDSIDILFGEKEEFHKYSVMVWKLVVEVRTTVKQFNPGVDNIVNQYTNKIKKYEPSYNNSDNQTQTQQSQTSGGCYIATAVYGSYDCPQVWILRRYRDSVLACSKPGRAFIKLYYAVSPMLVKWFGQTKVFKEIWRNFLDRLVSKLKDKGVEDTPYDDIVW